MCIRDRYDTDLRILSHSFGSLVLLTELSLNFENVPSISDLGIQYLIQSLPEFSKLTSLKLNLNRCINVTHRTIKKIVSALRESSNITEFSLLLQYSGFSDRGIPILSKLIRNLTRLKVLSISLSIKSLHHC
eukprot:TRINITY_DN11471_c0_g1_i3.p1 TRINITY_DN11471_c0_g1~~TRINITY_DN11471_c0_g1_i3.p1  ORF type:complete len:132 (-),score=13.26 TRINITY_DN11471_c0_g1_i3:539-934(-)